MSQVKYRHLHLLAEHSLHEMVELKVKLNTTKGE